MEHPKGDGVCVGLGGHGAHVLIGNQQMSPMQSKGELATPSLLPWLPPGSLARKAAQ